jgi:hypothetical protein
MNKLRRAIWQTPIIIGASVPLHATTTGQQPIVDEAGSDMDPPIDDMSGIIDPIPEPIDPTEPLPDAMIEPLCVEPTISIDDLSCILGPNDLFYRCCQVSPNGQYWWFNGVAFESPFQWVAMSAFGFLVDPDEIEFEDGPDMVSFVCAESVDGYGIVVVKREPEPLDI